MKRLASVHVRLVYVILSVAVAMAMGVMSTLWLMGGHRDHPHSTRLEAPPAATPAVPKSLMALEPNPLTEKERAVLSRLAQLPDLPLHGEPEFNLPRYPGASGGRHTAPAAGESTTDISGTAPPQVATAAQQTARARKAEPAQEATMIDIEVVAVERGRLYYRALDGMTHVAGPGQRLLGVNGHVVRIRGDQVDLQIDGRALTVSATNT